jgi:uncharacterized protein (TIGR02996 family)
LTRTDASGTVSKMSNPQRDAFLQAIREQPDDNTHRLVFADWLDDQGDTTHAQLIRVQCELADRKCKGTRRKELCAQEATLVHDPAMQLPTERPFTYDRGFVRDRCRLFFDGRGFQIASEVDENTRSAFEDLDLTEEVQPIDQEHAAILDRMLDLSLELTCLDLLGAAWDDSFFAACLRRVTELECLDGTAMTEDLVTLAASPNLVNVEAVTFHSASDISVPGVAALFAAPAHRGLRRLHLDGETWESASGEITDVDAPGIVEFVRGIAQDPRSARLTYFALHYSWVSSEVVQALLDSPCLQPAEGMQLVLAPEVGPAERRALKKRFGKALRLL